MASEPGQDRGRSFSLLSRYLLRTTVSPGCSLGCTKESAAPQSELLTTLQPPKSKSFPRSSPKYVQSIKRLESLHKILEIIAVTFTWMFFTVSSSTVWGEACSCEFWWDLLHSGRKGTPGSLSAPCQETAMPGGPGVRWQQHQNLGLDIACKICHRPSLQSKQLAAQVGRGQVPAHPLEAARMTARGNVVRTLPGQR